MAKKGVIAEPPWRQGRCPFCCAKLGKVEEIRRKVSKVFKCKRCGIIIDERFIVR